MKTASHGVQFSSLYFISNNSNVGCKQTFIKRVFWSEQLQICHNDPGDAAFPLSQVPLSDSAEAAAADGFTPSAGKEQISSGGSEAELTSRQRQSRQKETQSPQFHLIVL